MNNSAQKPVQDEQPLSRVFNPNEHLIQIRSGQANKDYLPVQWRLVWFRSIFPQGEIETQMLQLDLDRDTEEESFAWNNENRRSEKVIKQAKGFCVFHATVKDGVGGMATGTKSEKAASFPDFIEKSETGAIGRALAALGYGTQFTGDEWEEAHRIVDAPVERENNTGAGSSFPQEKPPVATRRPANSVTPQRFRSLDKPAEKKDENEATTGVMANDRQKNAIRNLSKQLRKNVDESLFTTMTEEEAGSKIQALTAEQRQSKAS